MAHLYELTQELALIHEELEASGGELTPYLEEKLSRVEMGLEQKSEAIAKWIKNLNSDVDSLEKEIERLQLRKRSRDNVVARLKNYVKVRMEQAGIRKIDHPVFPIRIQNNSQPSVEILDPKAVPARFQIVLEPQIDKKAIAEAHNNGEDVSAFAKVERGTHLRIE